MEPSSSRVAIVVDFKDVLFLRLVGQVGPDPRYVHPSATGGRSEDPGHFSG